MKNLKRILASVLVTFTLTLPVMATDSNYCEQLGNPNEIGECIENKASPEVVRLLVASRALNESTIRLEKAVERLQ